MKKSVTRDDGSVEVVDMSQEEIESIPGAALIKSVTRRQARKALHAAGLLSAVDSFFEGQPMDIRIDYEDAQTFERDWPTLALAADAIGLSSDQIDELFQAAAGLLSEERKLAVLAAKEAE